MLTHTKVRSTKTLCSHLWLLRCLHSHGHVCLFYPELRLTIPHRLSHRGLVHFLPAPDYVIQQLHSSSHIASTLNLISVPRISSLGLLTECWNWTELRSGPAGIISMASFQGLGPLNITDPTNCIIYGHHPTHKGNLRNVMKYSLEPRYGAPSLVP